MSTQTQAAPLLDLRGVGRDFPAGEGTLTVLQDIDLQIHAGEMVAIVGQSGSGKSTLMNLIGCLDQASRGRYAIAGREVAQLSPDELAELRREHFGFIFQRYHLLSDLTAQGNVEVPAVYAGLPAAERHSRAQALLQRLGLGDRTQHVPGKLSGGQQQRVSIARALMNGGSVILADEPTGALDSGSGEEVMRILGELHAQGHTIIIVTHDMGVARHAERIVELKDGRIVSDAPNTPAHRGPAHTRADRAARPDPGPPLARHRRQPGRGLPHGPAGHERAPPAHPADHAGHHHRHRLGGVGGGAGPGSQQKVLANISSIGTNTIEVFSGQGFGDPRSAASRPCGRTTPTRWPSSPMWTA
jgi:macrolide transport system ATP-binding/permease protein